MQAGLDLATVANHAMATRAACPASTSALGVAGWLQRGISFEATLHMLMFRRQARRLTTTMFVVLSLLFSQLALANYVCPPAAPVQSAPMPTEMTVGEPCESMGMEAGKAMDLDQPVLCHQHCVNAAQSFDPVQVPTVSLPAVVQVLFVPLLLDASASESIVFAHAGRERPPPDPLFLSTLRLRV